MNIRNRRSINLFTSQLSPITRSILYPVTVKTGTTTNYNLVTLPNLSSMTMYQYNTLLKIEEIYTSKLSNKTFVNIPSNIDEYVTLLNGIQGMNSIDYGNNAFQLLLSIGAESLIGSLHMYALYEKSMFNELKMRQANKTLQEILSKVNEIGTMENVSGQFEVKKVFRLAPMYSDYIYLYGLPICGVGFDPVKLAFVGNLSNQTLK
jgi:hypothetical protein